MKIFNRNKKELTSLNDTLEDIDENTVEKEDIDKFIYLPCNFVVGYYEGMTQKGLREYINGYVFKYFDNPSMTNYRMIKYDAGYIFEIHDGDSETSYLKKIITSFNEGNNNVIIKVQNRIAKVTKNFNKITTYLLPEIENDKHANAMLPEKGKMKPIQPTGFGFISFGIAISVLGVTSLFLSSLFKTVLSNNETFKFEKQIIESPSTYIEKLPVAVETSYISKVWFENNNWDKKETKIKTVEMENLENNNRFMSRLNTYTRFVERCASKTSLNDCNDDNPFLDKIMLSPNENISKLTLKNGIIELDFKNNEDYIKYIPVMINNKIEWKYECSKSNLADICKLPSTNIINKSIEKKEELTINDILVNVVDKNETGLLGVPEVIKNEVLKIEEIIKDPIKEIQKEEIFNIIEVKSKNLEILNNRKEDNLSVPESLDLSEIPENIIIE